METTLSAIKLFKRIFNQQDPLVKDHIIKGVSVVSGSTFVDISLQLMEKMFAGQTIVLEDFQWIETLAIHTDSHTLYTTVEPSDEVYHLGFRTQEDGIRTLHASTKGCLEAKKTIQTSIDVRRSSGKFGPAKKTQEVYKLFRDKGLEYGAAYQVIQEVSFSPVSAFAKLSLSEPPHDSFCLHPSLLDGALQVAEAFLLNQENEAIYIPASFQKLCYYKKLPQSVCVLIEQLPNKKELEFDLFITDETGNLLAEIKGFKSTKIKTPGVSAEKKTDMAISLFAPTWEKITPEESEKEYQFSLIIDWGNKLNRQLTFVSTLTNFIVLTAGKSYCWKESKICEIDPQNAEEYNRFLKELKEKMGSKLDRIIDISANESDADITRAGERFTITGIQLLYFYKALANVFPKNKIDTFYIYSFQENLFEGTYQGLYSFFISLQKENSMLRFRVIGVEKENMEAIEPYLKNTIAPVEYFRVGGYTDEQYAIKPIPSFTDSTIHAWKEQGVYVITGGTGSIAKHLVRKITTTVNAVIYLLGRSEPFVMTTFLEEITKSGNEIYYLQTDITNAHQVKRAFKTILTQKKQIHGIYHCAGVLNDSLYFNKSKEHFLKTIAPKISGLCHLEDAIEGLTLDHFVVFSSVASVKGNRGQCDYAAANAFMDAFAHYRNKLVKEKRKQGKTMAVNWPLWEDGGMNIPKTLLEDWIAATGIIPLKTEACLQLLQQLIMSPYEQVIPLKGDAVKIFAYLDVLPVGDPNKIIDKTEETVHKKSETSLSAPSSLIQKELKPVLKKRLKELLAETVKITTETISDEANFKEYALDSFHILKLTQSLEKIFGKLPKTLFYEYTTIEQLSDYFILKHSEKSKQLLPVKTIVVEQIQPSVPSADEQLLEYLRALAMLELKVEISKEEYATSFNQFGLDSFLILKITRRLEKDFGKLPKTLFYEYNSLLQLCGYFKNNHQKKIIELLQKQASIVSIKAQETLTEIASEKKKNLPYVVLSEKELNEDVKIRTQINLLISKYGEEPAVAAARKAIAPMLFVAGDLSSLFYYAVKENILLVFSYVGDKEQYSALLDQLIEFAAGHSWEINILDMEDRISIFRAKKFNAVPLGVMQRIHDLSSFSLAGSKMKRLRYQITHYQKSGPGTTKEYSVGSNKDTDAKIIAMIDSWSRMKSMINPYIEALKNNIAHARVSSTHRFFLTYQQDVLQNVIVISNIASMNGYLMDLEFYSDTMPLGGLEFAITEIIEQLKKEHCSLFSLGATFGARIKESEMPDINAEETLTELRNNKVFDGEGNLQFKKKFRTSDTQIYLYRASNAEASSVAEVIMMIANPDMGLPAVQQPQIDEFKNNKIPSVSIEKEALKEEQEEPETGNEDLQTETVNRRRQLNEIGYNPIYLSSAEIELDFNTDSWKDYDGDFMCSYLKDLTTAPSSNRSLEEIIKSVFPLKHVSLVAQG